MSESDIAIEPLQLTDLPFSGIKLFRTNSKHDRRGIVTPTYNRLFFNHLEIAFDMIHENWCCPPRPARFGAFITNGHRTARLSWCR